MPRRLRVNDSSDEEPSQSQSGTQLGRSQSSGELSDSEKKVFASNMCNYLIAVDCKKIPAKIADMVKAVMKEHGKHFKTVLAETDQILQRIFGYKVMELKKNKNQFILINTLLKNTTDNSDAVPIPLDIVDAPHVGLLTAILSGIFMSGDVMHEGPMREYLKELGVYIDSREEHPVFGNVSKYIHQDLVKQQYLEISLNKDVDPPANEYRWGERAHLELSKKDILVLVCKIYGNNMRPEDWASQWKLVQEEEEEEENS